MRSMTGFGEAQSESLGINVRISSVNGRFHELNLYVDRALGGFEKLLRDELKTLGRGSIKCQVNLENDAAQTFRIDSEAFKGIQQEYKKHKFRAFTPSLAAHLLPYYVAKSKKMSDEELGAIERELLDTLHRAMDEFGAVADREGKGLEQALLELLDSIETHLAHIIAAQDELQTKLHERLVEQVSQLTENPDTERIAEEVSLLVIRYSVAEEITRLGLHLEALRTAIAEDKGGKHMDFLIQELHRETNTIGSKNPMPDLVPHIIAIKEAIEDMREQLRNVQ